MPESVRISYDVSTSSSCEGGVPRKLFTQELGADFDLNIFFAVKEVFAIGGGKYVPLAAREWCIGPAEPEGKDRVQFTRAESGSASRGFIFGKFPLLPNIGLFIRSLRDRVTDWGARRPRAFINRPQVEAGDGII